jgi:hypothetical protein
MRAVFMLILLSGAWVAAAGAQAPDAAAPADADTAWTGWKRSADVALTFNQSAYSDSWAGQESAAISWTWTADLVAERQLSPSFNWKNTLKLAFGQTHQEAEPESAGGSRRWKPPQKSTDRVFFETLLRATLGGFVDPFVGVTAETQFYDPAVLVVADGPDSTAARFLHPLLLTESAGIGRTLVKNERAELYSRFGFAVRERFEREVRSFDPERFESRTTTDGGLEWVTDYTQSLGTDLKYVTKLRVFEALFNSRSDELEGLPGEDDWKTPDAAWENTLSAAVAKYIQVSLFFELLYDKEIDERGRLRETLGLGLAYKLF